MHDDSGVRLYVPGNATYGRICHVLGEAFAWITAERCLKIEMGCRSADRHPR